MSGRSGRIAGIPVGISPLWPIIVALIARALGAGYYPGEVHGITTAGPAEDRRRRAAIRLGVEVDCDIDLDDDVSAIWQGAEVLDTANRLTLAAQLAA